VPHLLQTEAGLEDFKQLYMPNAPDQILCLSQFVKAGYVPHFQPSAQKSWLTTPCKKCITVVLVDSVWRLPLWRDSARPWVLRSGTVIAGSLRPQRTLDAAHKRVTWHTDCLPPSEASNLGEPSVVAALGSANKRVSLHTDCLPFPEASNSGEPLPGLFPNSGEPLQSPRPEENLAMESHLHCKCGGSGTSQC